MKRMYISPVTEKENCLTQSFLCASPAGETPLGGIGEDKGGEFIPM